MNIPIERFGAALCIAAIALAGCGSNGSPETEAPEADVTLTGTWNLIRIGDDDPPESVKTPNLTIDEDGNVSGFAGVNRINGTMLEEGDTVFGPLMMTRMAGPGPAMQLEDAFSSALSAATGYKVEGDTLTFTSPGQPDVVMKRQ